jgi:hypothetical protein
MILASLVESITWTRPAIREQFSNVVTLKDANRQR